MKTNRKINPADDISCKKLKLKAKSFDEKEASRKDWARYLEDVKKSECFEVGEYPHIDLRYATGYPAVTKIYDSSSQTDQDLEDEMLLYLAKLAICLYNIVEDADFGNVKVLMATRSGIKNENHYITFEAFLSTRTRKKVAVTFQTHIVISLPHPFPKFEIMFVRIKPSQSHPPNNSDESHHQVAKHGRLSRLIDSGLDSRYSLDLYLSQYALFTYNLRTLSLRVAKHDIESLEVVQLMKSVAEVPTYRITFEAPLRSKTKMKSVDTFQTEICMPSLFPTTIIELKKFQKRK